MEPMQLEVKQWLKETGRTQSSLAHELGINPPVISLWMSGKNGERKQELTTQKIRTLMERVGTPMAAAQLEGP
ncbi:hypothetical protein T492DRAFT_892088, partial [Pavlovales sp. CCMP2436]